VRFYLFRLMVFSRVIKTPRKSLIINISLKSTVKDLDRSINMVVRGKYTTML